MDRIALVRRVMKDAGLPNEAEGEKVVNAVLAHFKSILTPEQIQSIARSIPAADLRSIWLTSSLPAARPFVPRVVGEEGGESMAEHFAIFYHGTHALEQKKLPHAVGGGIAVWAYGRRRETKDIDVFVRKRDAEAALEILRSAGFRTEHADENWLYKAYMGNTMVDVIFESSLGLEVDEILLRRARRREIAGHPFRVMSPEDLLLFKLFSSTHDSPHWEDCLQVVRGCDGELEWDYLVSRGESGPCALLSFILYARWLLGRQVRIPSRLLTRLARGCSLLGLPQEAAV